MPNVLPRMVAGFTSPYPTVHMLTQDHQNECRMELNGDCSNTVTQFGFFLYGYVQRNPALLDVHLLEAALETLEDAMPGTDPAKTLRRNPSMLFVNSERREGYVD